MAYTYTERKRIRKNFGNRDSVLVIPYLLQMQKDAYTSFLQAGVLSSKRTHEGLQAAFESAFPIVSHNGFVEMKFVEYNLAKPAFDVRECQTRGLTFASAVRARVQLIIYDRDSSTSQSWPYDSVGRQGDDTGEIEGNPQLANVLWPPLRQLLHVSRRKGSSTLTHTAYLPDIIIYSSKSCLRENGPTSTWTLSPNLRCGTLWQS